MVVVADPLASRRAIAAELGFEQVLDSSAPEFVERVFALTDGRGVDLVSEAAGVEAAFQLGIACLAEFGRLLVQGTHGSPVTLDLGDYTMHRQTTLVSTWNIGSPHHRSDDKSQVESRANLELSMELVARGHLPSAELITHRFPFDDIARIYNLLGRGSLESMQVVLTV